MGELTSSHSRARKIVAGGGQILLPYDAGDASVMWESRRALVEEIKTEIEAAVTEALGLTDQDLQALFELGVEHSAEILKE